MIHPAPRFALASLGVAALLAIAAPGFGLAASGTPRLAVVVVFDQLRAADADRYHSLFGPGGFGGLEDGGARYDAVYSYSATETGPGHATLLTGANPSMHGIVSNRWTDGLKQAYVVDDPNHTVLGLPTLRKGPFHLEVGTLGDAMKVESGGLARVVTISTKDRSAILTGGRSADMALWYEADLGAFTTSTAYAQQLPKWALPLAGGWEQRLAEFAPWTQLPIDGEHQARFSLRDSHPGESPWQGLGTSFPYEYTKLTAEQRRVVFPATPYAIDAVFQLSLQSIDACELGKDDEPDLLVVSVAATDLVGHLYGPGSAEMLDMLRRASNALRRFREDIDAKVGPENWMLTVSSDHGGTPVVERVRDQGQPAQRIAPSEIKEAAERAITGILGAPKAGSWVAALYPPHLYLNRPKGVADTRWAQALDACARAVEAHEHVSRAWAPALGVSPAHDPFWSAYREVVFPGRSGDILIRQRPRFYYRYGESEAGSDHGTPYQYDARVPMWFLGPGVRAGRYAQPIDPRDLAATLAFVLRAPHPDACEGKPVTAVGAESQPDLRASPTR